MTPATVHPQSQAPPTPSMADLLRDLGDVPPSRVLLRAYPATEEDVVWMDAHEDRLCELVDGVLVEKPMGFRESILAAFIIWKLKQFVSEHGLGTVSGEAGMMRLRPRLVRIPDVAYIRRIAAGLPEQRVPAIAPTLAVEVLSQSNTAREIERKIAEYFAAGTELVWVIDPDSRTAEIYTSPQGPRHIDITGVLPGEPTLPGFSLSMKEMFDDLDAQYGKQ